MTAGQRMTRYADCESMSVYRISKGQDVGEIADTIEDLELIARQYGPGHYPVDEIGSDPMTGGHTSRKWGTVIVAPDGTAIFDRDPWPES
jgi:hypothetical protein